MIVGEPSNLCIFHVIDDAGRDQSVVDGLGSRLTAFSLSHVRKRRTGLGLSGTGDKKDEVFARPNSA